MNIILFYLQSLTDTIQQQGMVEVMLYALTLGIIPAILSLIIYKRSKYLTCRLAFNQQLLLKVSIFFFLIMTIAVASRPLEDIILGVSAFLKVPNLDILRIHVGAYEDFVNDILQIISLPASSSLEIWIPSVFLLFTLHYIFKNNDSKQFKIRLKLVRIVIGLTFFSVLALPNIVGAFIPYEQHLLFFFLLIGPTIASIISSFLTAEGYAKTMKENLDVIKGNSIDRENAIGIRRLQQPQSPINGTTNKLKTACAKFLSEIHLGINTIGLSRNLFLIGIIFTSVGFPLSYTVINQVFANTVADYVTGNQGQSLEAGTNSLCLIYNAILFLLDI